MTTLLLTQIPVWAGIVLVVYWIAVLIFLVDQDREPTSTLAWLFVLLFLPFLGVLFYYFFGRDWRERTARSKWAPQAVALMKRGMAPDLRAQPGRRAAFPGRLRRHLGRRHLRGDRRRQLQPPPDGEQRRDLRPDRRLLRPPAGATSRPPARSSICSTSSGRWTSSRPRSPQILLERVAAGVEVRILYDNLGSRAYRKDELTRLAQAGAHVTADVVERAQLNYRDHRKVTVIDGEIGYTGGSNMGQEYIDGGERFASLARHEHQDHRPGRRRAAEAVRLALVSRPRGRGPAGRALLSGAGRRTWRTPATLPSSSPTPTRGSGRPRGGPT